MPQAETATTASPTGGMNPAASQALDEVDWGEILRTLWRRRWIIAGIVILGTALATAYAIFAPKAYESTVLLIPTEAPKLDQLGAAASLLGKKGTSNADLDLYQSLLTSRTVIKRLLQTPVRDLSDSGRGRMAPLAVVLGIDTASPRKMNQAARKLAKSVKVETPGAGAGGIIQVTMYAPQPWLAQQQVDFLVEIGQEAIRKVRIERSDAVMGRLNLAARNARDEWDRAARRLAAYQDQNRSIFLPSQRLDVDRLAMERQVVEQKYLMARREVEQQLLDREKATPPALVMDPADLPDRPSKPKPVLIIALGVIASLILSSISVLLHATVSRRG